MHRDLSPCVVLAERFTLASFEATAVSLPLVRRVSVGEFADKAKGVANEAIGKTKEAVGKATGDHKLEASGAAQVVKGKAEKAIGDAKGAIKKHL